VGALIGVPAAVCLVAVLAVLPRPTNAHQYRGAASHLLWPGVSTADARRELSLLRRAGADAVRLDVSWSSLESARKGRLTAGYVRKADAVFAAARAHDLKVILTLWSTPCWASSAPGTLKRGCSGAWWDRGVDRYPPRRASDFADAAVYVARRWSKYLAAIELWNEPNGTDAAFLRAPDQAAAYAALVKAAYPRIKHVVPDLPVLAGALSFSDGDFLGRLYGDGIGGHFDGLSVHPYNEWRSPYDRWRPQWTKYSFIAGVPWIHAIMQRHGDGRKPIWLTEFGFSSCRTGDRWCVTRTQQARYVAESFRVAADWPFVKGATVYNLRNKGSEATDREAQFGLVERDFAPKPAYGAFVRELHRLRGR
jgi:polysaccharide biosynthesis protein PslG